MNLDEITLEQLQETHEKLKQHPDVFFETPVFKHAEQQLKQHIPNLKSLTFKLETMQCTGSFKARGVVHQFISLSDEDRRNKRLLVTMSAGNYGKAFSHVAKLQEMPAVVFMPDSAPVDRKHLMESYGATVFRCPRNSLMENVNKHQKEHGSLFLHSFDDPNLIVGHASAGLELVKQLKEAPDVVIVCCGGGGFISGVSLGLKLYGWTSTKIYGVEPEAAPTMYEAVRAGHIVNTQVNSTIAAGLAPPFAGTNTLKMVQIYVEDIVLVSDDEIKSAISALYNIGLVVEPSGAAAFAALSSNKISDVHNKHVVVFLTGKNVSLEELQSYILK